MASSSAELEQNKRWSKGWKERILTPTLLAGVVGGGVGLLSKHRATHGAANISATYAVNSSIVAASYCGAREFVRATRASSPDDLLNSALGGFASGALLGCLQGGQIGAIKYSIIFAIAGTAIDFTTQELLTQVERYKKSDSEQKNGGWLKLPEWSPIQVLDEEALAAKRAREEQLRAIANLDKEEC